MNFIVIVKLGGWRNVEFSDVTESTTNLTK